ncbi:Cu(I)-responsive transcriptional regulator [soil metagenome]
MRIGELAQCLGTTPHAIRWYERRGLLPATERTENGYRSYTERDASRLRLLVGLRSLDLPLDQAAELASLCAEGKCDQVSADLRAAIADKRQEIARRSEELQYLDHRLAHLAGELDAGKAPRPLIVSRKEDRHDHAV